MNLPCVVAFAFGTVLVSFVMGQKVFPDIPDNHWANESLRTLKKDGLMAGYPDTQVRYYRSPTRIEIASAIQLCFKIA